jgi:hypothetical protein
MYMWGGVGEGVDPDGHLLAPLLLSSTPTRSTPVPMELSYLTRYLDDIGRCPWATARSW